MHPDLALQTGVGHDYKRHTGRASHVEDRQAASANQPQNTSLLGSVLRCVQ